MKAHTKLAATILAMLSLALGSSEAFNPSMFVRSKPRTSSALGMRRSSLVPSNFFSSGFEDFFDDPFFWGSPMPLLTKVPRNADMTLRRSSPCFEISEDDTKFQLAMDVPGVKISDLNIQLEEDGRVLRISGERKGKEGNTVTQSRFEKAFRLDKSIDTDQLSANVADGVLSITAPKSATATEVRQIPVLEGASLPAEQDVPLGSAETVEGAKDADLVSEEK